MLSFLKVRGRRYRFFFDKINFSKSSQLCMSVYTSYNKDELAELLDLYALGEVKNLKGIADGITNTNYFLDTELGSYVLTIFEQNTLDEMPFFMDLMVFLNEQNIPCAHPIATKTGDYVFEFLGKPVAIVERLQGTTIVNPNNEQCAALGKALAEMHVASNHFDQQRNNDRGPHWWHSTYDELAPKLGAEDLAILKAEITYQESFKHLDCPRGIIHADLFPDNILFDGEHLTGIIDYYYACSDVLLYDIAVSVNAWCNLDDEKSRALLTAYQQVRAFSAEEKLSWNTMLRAAALRFWLSRMHSVHFRIEGEITQTINPDEMRDLLLHHIQYAEQNTALVNAI